MHKRQSSTKYRLGDIVKHRDLAIRGVVYDVDPKFDHTDEFWQSIPKEDRPDPDQPFYHLLAENGADNDTSYYMAYVPEQHLVLDDSDEPVDHPALEEFFVVSENGQYRVDESWLN